MPIERKRGALSNQEQDFILKNYHEMTVAEMAEQLNRNQDPILRFMKNNSLEHRDIAEPDELKQKQRVKNLLQKKYWFPNVKAQLLRDGEIDELEIFMNKWIDMFIQFKEDVLALEEAQMNELCMLYISLERIRKQEVKNIKRLAEIEKELADEYDQGPNRDDALIQRLEGEFARCQANSMSFFSQIKATNHDIQKLNEDLKGTRNQRFAKIDSGDKTFVGLIRRLQDDLKRKQVSREAELVRIATEKKRAELYEYHQYGDNKLDIPILNYESAKKIREEGTEEVKDEPGL
jgi:hypothetical protein